MTVQIGPLTLHVYGIIIMLGVLAGTWLTARRARLHGLRPEWIWDLVPWMVIGGVIGARLWHILFPPASMIQAGYTTRYYLTHPLEAIAVWKGGLGMPGVLLGGAVSLYLYLHFTKRLHLFLHFGDAAAPGIALGQAIGRWGNYVNQELYGRPTNLPWAIYIEPRYRMAGYENVAYYHPLFLYESLWNLFNMAALIYIDHRWHRKLLPGDLFLMYLLIYGVGRFFLEFLRLDPAPLGTINVNQTVMAAVVVFSGALLWWRQRGKPAKPPVAMKTIAPDGGRRSRRRRKKKRKR